MKKLFETGLVVGKFSPMHLGHTHLIKTAADQCEKLFVISYSNPEFHKCDTATRESWIDSALYNINSAFVVIDNENVKSFGTSFLEVPKNDDEENIHRSFCAEICQYYFQTQIDAVFSSENYGDGFANFLTIHFKQCFNSTNIVEHVCVDLHRTLIPISATQVRANVSESSKYVPINVLADLFPRVTVLGGESSGKTTFAIALNSAIDQKPSLFISEFGRTLWNEKKGNLKFQDMLKIAEMQIYHEHAAAFWYNYDVNKKMLICDTAPITTEWYSQQMFNGQVNPRLSKLSRRDYDLYILCEPDFEFVQDGTRRDESFRTEGHEFFKKYVTEKAHNGALTLIVSGSVEERVEQAKQFLSINGYL